MAGACRGRGDARPPPGSGAILRVGVAQLSPSNPTSGLRQLSQNQAVENLVRVGEDGRFQPWLAESLAVAPDGRSVTVKLRPGVTFHDGSPLDSAALVDILPAALRAFTGPLLASGIEHVGAAGRDAVEIRFQDSAPFLRESLEVPIQKPGQAVVGTGPFMSDPRSQTDLPANPDYYLGRSLVERIRLESYPSLRAAWAELLRGRLDMLYDVGPDDLSSLEGATNVAVFTFTRRYQFVIALNTDAPALRSRDIRRALNMAIDRVAVVRDALSGQGVASSGLVWPRHWAFNPEASAFPFDPKQAARLVASRGGSRKVGSVRFTCLVPAGTEFERLALETKRQLAGVGVDMVVEEASLEDLMGRIANRRFEAALLDVVSGPTLLRPYLVWHSRMQLTPGGLGNPTVDAALDRVRHAPAEPEYRQAVAGLQQAFLDDPPAIFLAWSVRARAVSTRFVVPAVEPGRDVVGTLRLWKPAEDTATANRH